MSKTVLEVVKEGIKKVEVSDASCFYDDILKDFYDDCYVNDLLYPSFSSSVKYGMTYSCFDKKRNKSMLEVMITKEMVNVSQIGNDFKRIFLLTNFHKESFKKASFLLSLTFSNQTIESKITFSDDNFIVEKRNKNNKLCYYTDLNVNDYEEKLPFSVAFSKMYKTFKNN